MSRTAVEFAALHSHFGDTVALADIDLRIAPGTTTALVGESGSGKSTLLRLAAGLVTPTRGTVTTLGVDPSRDRGIRHRIGYVIQEGGLFPHLSCRDNVALPARASGWPAGRIAGRIAELAQRVNLPMSLMSRPPHRLSGGQRQRVALMRALMLEPDLLLLDEPLGALDPVIRHELQRELKSLFDQPGLTVVLVTHDLAEAAFLSQDLVVLRDGRMVQRGSFDTLQDRPEAPYVSDLITAVRGLPG